MKEFSKLFASLSTVAATVAVLVSLGTLTSLVKFDRDLLFAASAAIAGAGVSVAYAYVFIRLRQRMRERHAARVFISYSHKDSDFVMKLAHDLRKLGVVPIVDRLELKVGDEIRAAVDRLIDNCDYVIFVASENTVQSSWSKREIEQAVKREKKILPVVLNQGSLPEELQEVYYADFSSDYDAALALLARTFKRPPNLLFSNPSDAA